MIYQYDKCPVCSSLFKEGDDIVTCPHCGTPHHRNCYAEKGRCANAALHNHGFIYKRKSAEDIYENSGENAVMDEDNKNQDEIPSALSAANHLNSEIPGEEKTNVIDSSLLQQLRQNFSRDSAFVYKKDEKLDDVYLSDVITAVGVNFPKFVPKFRKNRTISWNWSAFFFGPYYLFFRKMYKQGAAFLALDFIGRLIVSMLFATELNAFFNAAMAADTKLSNIQYMKLIFDSMVSTKAWIAYAIISAVMLVLHIIIAMISDRIYRSKTVSLIKNVDSKLADDELFSADLILGFNGKNLSPREMRDVFLAGRGGVNYLAPVIAFFVMNLAAQLISGL